VPKSEQIRNKSVGYVNHVKNMALIQSFFFVSFMCF